MTTRTIRLATLTLLALTVATPAVAKHRQTAPVTPLTVAGDTPLPRTISPAKRILTLAIGAPGNQRIVTVSPFIDPTSPAQLAPLGDNANPAISYTGRSVAWDTTEDPLGTGLPGRQVVAQINGILTQVSSDPSGTSANPSLDTVGRTIAWESSGNLTGDNPSGASQIFLKDRVALVRQLSAGSGTSRNVVVSARKGWIAFESSSHPITGADTGVPQIWFGNASSQIPAPLTAGLGSSRNAAISDDGRILTFESEADLAGNGADTGVPQIFVYDTKTATFARVTNDAGGCTLPAAAKVKRDYRIAFVCGGTPYFYMLRAESRFQVQTGGGHTQRVAGELGIHFMALSTTGNLAASGTTPGHQVYLVNLYKRPAQPVAGPLAVWWPFRGLSAF
ncbi:MAG: PD40 domain-containing protein [bacterium]|nr:PD40 domain-containing protein [bacterium]